MARELRERGLAGTSRALMSYNIRTTLEPEESLEIVLKNIFFGATDDLKTGWSEDVKELNDMAYWNFQSETKSVIVGPDWRIKLSNIQPSQTFQIYNRLCLPYIDAFSTHNLMKPRNVYLDGSRVVIPEGRWDDKLSWLSGNRFGTLPCYAMVDMLGINNLFQVSKYNVISDVGEFQLLCKKHWGMHALWLLVAMDGRSANFSRGRVAWTKIIHGRLSCSLVDAIRGTTLFIVKQVLEENLQTEVNIIDVTDRSQDPIEWV